VDAWASAGSGGSFRAVAPAAESGIGLVLRGERVTYENVRKNAYAQDGQELGASAGACRAGSLACAWFRPLPAPPARLSAPFACYIPRIFRFQVLFGSENPKCTILLYLNSSEIINRKRKLVA
jgi:hypothetical protein